jgi:hypothetical protein
MRLIINVLFNVIIYLLAAATTEKKRMMEVLESCENCGESKKKERWEMDPTSRADAVFWLGDNFGIVIVYRFKFIK